MAGTQQGFTENRLFESVGGAHETKCRREMKRGEKRSKKKEKCGARARWQTHTGTRVKMPGDSTHGCETQLKCRERHSATANERRKIIEKHNELAYIPYSAAAVLVHDFGNESQIRKLSEKQFTTFFFLYHPRRRVDGFSCIANKPMKCEEDVFHV